LTVFRKINTLNKIDLNFEMNKGNC